MNTISWLFATGWPPEAMKIFLAIFGTAALVGVVRSALGIWRPKHHGYWGGPFTGHASKNDPDKMRAGLLTHVAAVLWLSGFASAAYFSLFTGAPPRSSRIGLIPGICMGFILTGFFLMMIGWLLDSRAHDAARGKPPGTVEDRQRCIAVAGGSLILLMIAGALIFLK
jgi:hypothetical protein